MTARTPALVALLFGMALTPLARAACTTRPSPTLEFARRTDEVRALLPERVRALEAALFGPDRGRDAPRTDALIVVHQGAIFYERYARGYSRTMPHLGWSVTKSVTNLLTGIAVKDGRAALSDSVCRHLPWAPASRCGITVQHLLEFASGIDWLEEYESASLQDSSVIAMLFGEGHKDMARFVLEQETRDPPGTSYEYSTGESVLLGAVIDAAMTPAHGADYPWKLLFDPLGVTTATLEVDAAGRHVGGAYFYASPEDWARLGVFLLDDGCWEGKRLLPDGWVSASTTVSEPFLRKRVGDLPEDEQGRQFWLNRVVPGVRDRRPWPDMPEDTFSAIGHWGQFITVVPSKDLVIVRAGDDRDQSFDTNRFMALAMALTGEP